MKKILILFMFLISIMISSCGHGTGKDTGSSGQASKDTGTAKIVFTEYEHSFGKVAEGEKAGYTFTFENQGTSDLVIVSATTSCGCTVPEYDKKPVHPGNKGNLEVVFNTAGRNGRQTKTITVRSNSSTPVVLLKITADVVNSDK
jgi:hypothetical protein